MEKKEITPEEIEKVREKVRLNALKNLRSEKLVGLATAYFVSDDNNYGEYDNSAVEEFLYFPALSSQSPITNLETGKQGDLVMSSLVGSRQDGKRYSGQASEYGIINKAAQILQQSIAPIKVEDILKLVGSKIDASKIKESYKEKYISELLQSEDEKTSKFAKELVSTYSQYLVTQGVAKSHTLRTNQIRGGLEKVLTD